MDTLPRTLSTLVARHPAEAVLRRVLHEPAGVADADREHFATCPQCLDRLAALRANHANEPGPTARRTRTSSRSVLRRPLVAALAVAAVIAGASTAAANDWLPIFRTEQVAPVSISAADLVALPDLRSYGEVAVTGADGLREVSDARTAAARTGLAVPQVAKLPQGVSGDPVYQVGGKVSVTFTFSADRAAQAAEQAGEKLPAPPPGLDGSKVRLDAGPGVAQLWSSSSGAPALLVGRAVAPSAFSSGIEFETARDYLLSLPGLPKDVADKLRTFSADGSTLPLPVPADQVATSQAKVNGKQATVLTTRDRAISAVVWVDKGMVTAVAGSLDKNEVLSIARSLR
ncbi:hypothetical protein Kfla_0795 [Kribbella flavida DSM 17836]|uniref:DUF4367 domain-containing protein n=1 Tax=Kribbella flavida (strain DSM 17836 / JCM 10339 / NBRC 14399) TaxID=479435 RepID=D2PYR7_KRIFD|nr:hypothetical protein [Kribbella flavida]ADB29913.1 hypothetical protein Kfla_0795 [Kribbella flavida DSM 17836]